MIEIELSIHFESVKPNEQKDFASNQTSCSDPHGKWQYHQSQLCQICQPSTTTATTTTKKKNSESSPVSVPVPAGLAPFIIIDESTIPNIKSEKW